MPTRTKNVEMEQIVTNLGTRLLTEKIKSDAK